MVDSLLFVSRWAPPVLVGIVIGWAGVRSAGRNIAAGFGLLLLWIVPALTVGLLNAGGSRVLARYPAEMVRFGAEVTVTALTTPALAIPPVVAVAVAVAAVVIVVRQVRQRNQQGVHEDTAARVG